MPIIPISKDEPDSSLTEYSEENLYEWETAQVEHMSPIMEALKTPESTLAFQMKIAEGIQNHLDAKRLRMLDTFPIGTEMPPTYFELALTRTQSAYAELMQRDLGLIPFLKEPQYAMRQAYPVMEVWDLSDMEAASWGQYFMHEGWESRVTFKTSVGFLITPKPDESLRFIHLESTGIMDFDTRIASVGTHFTVYPLSTFDRPINNYDYGGGLEATGAMHIQRNPEIEYEQYPRKRKQTYEGWLDTILDGRGLESGIDRPVAYAYLYPFFFK